MSPDNDLTKFDERLDGTATPNGHRVNGRTPGSDGLTKEFYNFFWEMLGHDMVEMFNSSLTSGKVPDTSTEAIITLLYI